MRHLHFIDGAFEKPALGTYFDEADPATETVFANAAAGTAEDKVDASSIRRHA